MKMKEEREIACEQQKHRGNYKCFLYLKGKKYITANTTEMWFDTERHARKEKKNIKEQVKGKWEMEEEE